MKHLVAIEGYVLLRERSFATTRLAQAFVNFNHSDFLLSVIFSKVKIICKYYLKKCKWHVKVLEIINLN